MKTSLTHSATYIKQSTAILISILLLVAVASASIIVLFDPTTGRNPRRIDSVDTLQYLSRTDCLINPVFPTNPLSLCYVTNGQIQSIPQAWLDAEALAAWTANSNAQYQYQQEQNSNAFWTAMNFFSDNTNTVPLVMTALALETLRQHNMFRATNGMAEMTPFAMITKIVSNINYLKTNQ